MFAAGKTELNANQVWCSQIHNGMQQEESKEFDLMKDYYSFGWPSFKPGSVFDLRYRKNNCSSKIRNENKYFINKSE